MNIKSPVTLTTSVKKVDEFSVSEICKKYEDFGIDVTAYFEGLKTIDLYECEETGYKFYWPFTSIGDAAFYKNLSTQKPNYYSNRWEHKIALEIMSANEKILEVGSGFGAFLSLLNENSIIAKGLELNPHAVEESKKKGFNVVEKLVQTEAQDYPGGYDVVCYFQVLEHITEVHSFIAASVKLLKKGGKLIIGVPNNNPYLFINDKYHTLNLPPHHAGLWNESSLKNLERVFGLKVVSMEVEPLRVSYKHFINFHKYNANSMLLRKSISMLQKYAPRVLRKVVCDRYKGRNIFVVFKKL